MKSNSTAAREFDRYPAILNSFSREGCENASVYADVCRQTRGASPDISLTELEIKRVSIGVAGPVLCSYVLWILSRSREMGLKRLYFISRDGEILLEIAKRLLPAFWTDSTLELRYLYGSRQAWTLPSFVVSRREIAPYLLRFIDSYNLKAVFDRVDLTLQDCEPALLKHGFTDKDWERALDRHDFKSASALVNDSDIQELIVSRAQQQMDTTLGYLEQEGLFEDIPYGVVDVGWTGITKGALEKILSVRGKSAPPCFLFGRMTDKSYDDPSALHAYHFNINESEGIAVGANRNLSALYVLIEAFCISLSQGLGRYEYKDGRYVPLFRSSSSIAVQRWGYQTMRDSILRFADILARESSKLKPSPFLPPETSDALLRAFWRTPTKREAIVWGQFPYEEDPSGLSFQCLVPPIEKGFFWQALQTGNGFRKVSVWSRGVFAVNSPWLRFLWLLSMTGYRIRRRIFPS